MFQGCHLGILCVSDEESHGVQSFLSSPSLSSAGRREAGSHLASAAICNKLHFLLVWRSSNYLFS